jgi:diguanylate cyclase (GGDEF)-like protein
VQCRNDSSDWSPKVAAFEFTVLSPWWQRWWAYLLVVLVAGGMVWFIVLMRTRSLNRRRIELEAAVAQRSAELVEKNKALQEASLTDPLTQIRNRRYFNETVPAEAARVLRQFKGVPAGSRTDGGAGELIIVMADIDAFKRVNDAHGHSVGDRVLQEHAQRLAGVIRKGDVLVRWGGEEFMIVCHATPRENVPLLCQRLMEAVSATPYDLGRGVSLSMTCSFGWAPFPWSREEMTALSMDNVIELADKALYLAKSGGRNQAVGILPAEQGLPHGEEINIENLRRLPPAMVQVVRTANTTAIPAAPGEVKA